MNTLIELYDQRPIENVLGSEVLKPQRTVFLCTPSVDANTRLKQSISEFFKKRGLDTVLVFYPVDMYDAPAIIKALSELIKTYPDCVIDITGGTDDALFAAGTVTANTNVPVFTYSRKRNCFFNIQNAHFLDKLPCEVNYSVEDCFLMAGGSLSRGRVDNNALKPYLNTFDGFFNIYMRHKPKWRPLVKYMQFVGAQDKMGTDLSVKARQVMVNPNNGASYVVRVKMLEELNELGYIKDLFIKDHEIRFAFKDEQTRKWLRDIGSVLELYIYKLCVELNIFNSVITSAVVNWDKNATRDNVQNEIDIMCVKGVVPLFISCKTCIIDTDALNELAILRDRFGGNGAKAVIVTTYEAQSIAICRAHELGIAVIDFHHLKEHLAGDIIKGIMEQ